MRRLIWVWILGCGTAGCADDSARADGSGTGADSTGGGTAAGDADAGDADETGSDDAPVCVDDLDCDDGDPCTVDTCAAAGCRHDPLPALTNACRPVIEVDMPARAATIQGTAGDPIVAVAGRVVSPVADVQSLTLDGVEVEVAADGSFESSVVATSGGNLFVLELTDTAGNRRRRVQSFAWSTDYDAPLRPGEGKAPEALGLYLGQESLDDEDRSPPLDDIASLLQIVFDGFDVSTLFDPNTPIANYAGYDIYITDLELGDKAIGVQASDGGLRITAQIDDVLGDLFYDCTEPGCFFAGGDSTGGFSVQTLQIEAQVDLTATDQHQLAADLVWVDVLIDPDDVEVWSDNGWTDFLISVAEVFVHDTLVAEFETALEDTIEQDFGPVLTEGLAQIALALSFDFPNLGNARRPIVVDLMADFAATDFHDGVAPPAASPPAGGAVVLRGGGYASTVVTPWVNDGVVRRAGCGTGESTIALTRAAPVEIALHDDLLNQLLYAGWRGGLLEFPLDSEQLGGDGGFIEDFAVEVSGMLAPTASDCTDDGQLRVTIGDIRIDAALTLLGQPVTFEAYTTLVAGLSIVPTADGIAIELGEVERVETELTADDASIDLEPLLVESLQAQLVDGLLGELGGLGAFSLPDVDLGGLLGLAPGEAVLHMTVTGAARSPGTSVVAAHF